MGLVRGQDGTCRKCASQSRSQRQQRSSSDERDSILPLEGQAERRSSAGERRGSESRQPTAHIGQIPDRREYQRYGHGGESVPAGGVGGPRAGQSSSEVSGNDSPAVRG